MPQRTNDNARYTNILAPSICKRKDSSPCLNPPPPKGVGGGFFLLRTIPDLHTPPPLMRLLHRAALASLFATSRERRSVPLGAGAESYIGHWANLYCSTLRAI